MYNLSRRDEVSLPAKSAWKHLFLKRGVKVIWPPRECVLVQATLVQESLEWLECRKRADILQKLLERHFRCPILHFQRQVNCWDKMTQEQAVLVFRHKGAHRVVKDDQSSLQKAILDRVVAISNLKKAESIRFALECDELTWCTSFRICSRKFCKYLGSYFMRFCSL